MSNITTPTPKHDTRMINPDLSDWTVMVFLAGRNDLSQWMARSLQTLANGAANMPDGLRGRVNLLVAFGGAALNTPPMYFDLSGLGDGRDPLRRIGDMPLPKDPISDTSAESAAADSLLNFIAWCTKNRAEGGQGRRARKYFLVLSGHSLGFHGKALLPDESSGDHLTVPQLRAVLEQANQTCLADAEEGRLSILGFDSCVMSMVEVGFELREVAQTLIASEGSLPSSGWNYECLLSSLFDAIRHSGTAADAAVDPKAEAHTIATDFVRSFTTDYREISLGGGSMDISACDLDAVGPLARAIHGLGHELNRSLSEERDSRAEGLSRVILKSHYDSQTYMAEQYTDIKDLCERLIRECGDEFVPVAAQCRRVIEAVDRCVLKCGFAGDAYQYSNGLSVFFPWSSVPLDLADARYRALRFTSEDAYAGWYSFLRNYVGDISLRRSRTAPAGLAAGPAMYANIYQTDTVGVASAGRDVMPFTRSIAPGTRDAMPFTRGLGGGTVYYQNFMRFKNVEPGWNISGFADETDGP